MSLLRTSHLRFPILLLAAVVAGCGNSPESAIKDFYTNLEAGEISAASKALSPQIVSMLGEQKLHATLATETERINACGGIAAITSELVTKGEISNGRTTVDFKGTCRSRTEQVKLIKDNGSWTISASK